jgi:phosphoglycolate phosphatase-like HAD superfamily hydrolase
MKEIIRTCPILVFALIACVHFSVSPAAADPLPSWNDVASKIAIVGFVNSVTDKAGKDYVPPENRIATFDNDGTLWVEKPLYTHLLGVMAHIKEQMKADPSLAEREPYKAVAAKNLGYFMELYENASFETLISQLLGVPFGGMTHAQYDAWGRKFLAEFKHPKFKVGVEGLIYQPMVELIRYLEANDFTVYIFTADEGAFLRLAATKLYGLPPSQVHGTSMRSEFIVENGKAELVRTYRMHYLDNWDAKPRLIDQVIGKKPIFAAGNSNGDQHMLQYAALTGGMSVLVHHTDAVREYKYDKHTDKVMPLAEKEGWTVIDMADDWKTIFPIK